MRRLDSAEGVEEERKRQEKENRKKERERVRQAARDAEGEERRRNPKSPIDACYNWMETCPYPSGSKERKEWKRDNPLVFNGVTYVDHWSFQRSNSGKTSRPAGYLSGSDGSAHEIMNEHINNRRNDPNRNWDCPNDWPPKKASMAGKRRELGEHLNEAQRRIECVGKALPSSAWRSAARETPDDRRDNPQFGFYAGDFEDVVPGQFPGSGLAML